MEKEVPPGLFREPNFGTILTLEASEVQGMESEVEGAGGESESMGWEGTYSERGLGCVRRGVCHFNFLK